MIYDFLVGFLIRHNYFNRLFFLPKQRENEPCNMIAVNDIGHIQPYRIDSREREREKKTEKQRFCIRIPVKLRPKMYLEQNELNTKQLSFTSYIYIKHGINNAIFYTYVICRFWLFSASVP